MQTSVDKTQQGYSVAFENAVNDIEFEYIYQSNVLYRDTSDVEGNITKYYILDLETGLQHLVCSCPNVVLIGPGKTMLNGVFYFYQGEQSGNDIKNVLYAVDFSKMEMHAISENTYNLKLIPLTVINDRIAAFQIDKKENGQLEYFVEYFDEKGAVTNTVYLKECQFSDGGIEGNWSVVHLDSDQEYIYTVETITSEEEQKLFYVKYDLDFQYLESYDITDLTDEYIDYVGVFYAFGSYFCITDPSCNTVVCCVEEGEVEVIMSGSSFEYAVNAATLSEFTYFFQRGSNDIYCLNRNTGELWKQEYDTDNENSVIQVVSHTEGELMIVKKAVSEAKKLIVYAVKLDPLTF